MGYFKSVADQSFEELLSEQKDRHPGEQTEGKTNIQIGEKSMPAADGGVEAGQSVLYSPLPPAGTVVGNQTPSLPKAGGGNSGGKQKQGGSSTFKSQCLATGGILGTNSQGVATCTVAGVTIAEDQVEGATPTGKKAPAASKGSQKDDSGDLLGLGLMVLGGMGVYYLTRP